MVVETVLTGDNGMDARHLAVDSLQDIFQIDPDTLHARFLRAAPALAHEAALNALQQARLACAQVDAIIVSTCTGYLCPGLSGYVIERLGLRADVQAFDLVGQGCAAALPNLQLANALVASRSAEHVLSVCVEVCSAAMYLDDDPGVLISACLFGDGAGAAVLSRKPDDEGRRIEWLESESCIDPQRRQALQFETRQGMLRNVLTRQVPQLAAESAHQVFQTVSRRSHVAAKDITAWIFHAGGRDVLLALQKKFELRPHDLRHSAAMLRCYGNISSPFVYFVLQEALHGQNPGGAWWLSSFGAGFSCYGALLRVQ
ncbi:MAG: 3-oxoacyl-[acyl-carrier-protein] synthase III C-terminal domain-containing protein [Burkholderiaceae bacterium]